MGQLRRLGALRASILAGLLALAGAGTAVAVLSGNEHKTRPRPRQRVIGLSDLRGPAPSLRSASPAPSRSSHHAVSLDRLVGQRIMVGFSGTTPPQSLLQRIQNGTVGGVILFSANIQSVPQTRTLANQLQAAARAGGNPPLLIAVDQEGGSIRRFSSAPPDLSPPQMAASGNPSVAFKEGKKTGRALTSAGVNVDLAPVVDVATSPQSFIARQGRSFGSNPDTVASFADQFTKGLQQTGVLATAKHFPGVGSAAVDTDNKLETINASRKDLDAALRPYRHLAHSGVDMVMLSTAIFPAYDSSAPAALSRSVQQLLRRDVGFQGVTITDALESPTGMSTAKAGVTAAKSGVDVVLFTNDATAESAALRDAAGHGDVSRKNLESSYKRIAALKQSLKP